MRLEAMQDSREGMDLKNNFVWGRAVLCEEFTKIFPCACTAREVQIFPTKKIFARG